MSSPEQNPEQMPDAPISKRALRKVLMRAVLPLPMLLVPLTIYIALDGQIKLSGIVVLALSVVLIECVAVLLYRCVAFYQRRRNQS